MFEISQDQNLNNYHYKKIVATNEHALHAENVYIYLFTCTYTFDSVY